MKKSYGKINAVIILSFLMILFSSGADAADPPAEKSRINWEPVKGVLQYEVHIKDSLNRIVIKETTDKTLLEFSLPPGKYKIRIGAITKFDSTGSWTDWDDIEIKSKKPDTSMLHGSGFLSLGIRIGAGVSYNQIIDENKDRFNDALPGLTAILSYSPGYLPVLRSFWFMKLFGAEFEFNQVKYSGKSVLPKSNLSQIMIGGNLYFTPNFDFPLNPIFRIGAGSVLTKKTYDKNITAASYLDKESTDTYFKAGMSLEWRFIAAIYVEVGFDYTIARYISSDFTNMKYFVLLGTKL
jgi:hypothetical protein